MKIFIKLITAILLLLCLANMPYGYYEFVRFIAMVAFAYLAFIHFKADEEGLGIIFAALALLFQPFFKIALGRGLWNIVDVVVAIGLIYLTFSSKNNVKK